MLGLLVFTIVNFMDPDCSLFFPTTVVALAMR